MKLKIVDLNKGDKLIARPIMPMEIKPNKERSYGDGMISLHMKIRPRICICITVFNE
jgi:hypothetical protein